jgi:hypothetical protein
MVKVTLNGVMLNVFFLRQRAKLGSVFSPFSVDHHGRSPSLDKKLEKEIKCIQKMESSPGLIDW